MDQPNYLEQFKTAQDLEVAIKELIAQHRDAQNKSLGVMFRVQVPPNSLTLYKEGHQGADSDGNLYKLVHGVRVCDYNFETSTNLNYVIPDSTCGLSFSRTYSHLKATQKMLARHANGYQKPGPANVAWWILGDFAVPDGLEFVPDPKDNSHYVLAVTKRMHIRTLVGKLTLIAYRMHVLRDNMTR